MGITSSKSFLWCVPILHTSGTCSSCILNKNFATIFHNWGQILINCPNLTSIFIFKISSSNIPSNFPSRILKVSLMPKYHSLVLVVFIFISSHDSFFLPPHGRVDLPILLWFDC
jgi:hypothetical protein